MLAREKMIKHTEWRLKNLFLHAEIRIDGSEAKYKNIAYDIFAFEIYDLIVARTIYVFDAMVQ